MLNKKLAALLALSLVSALTVSAFAAGKSTASTTDTAEENAPAAGCYTVQVDGKSIGAKGCVMVPLRAVAEKLGFTVTWKNGAVLVDDGQLHTTVTIGKDLYLVSTSVSGAIGTTAPFSLGTPPYVANGVTYVPLGLFEVLLGNAEGAVSVSGSTVNIKKTGTESGSAQIANPFVDCETLSDAAKLAGFSITVPDTAAGCSKREFQAISGELIQVFYQDQNGEEQLMIRKTTGSEDCSGDYNNYAAVETVAVGGSQVTMKGNDGKVSVAVWTDGTHAYAIDASNGGLTRAAMSALVASVR